MNTLLALTSPTPLMPAILALFLKCLQSNSHRQTHNAGPFNTISQKNNTIYGRHEGQQGILYYRFVLLFYFILIYIRQRQLNFLLYRQLEELF